MRAAWGCVVRSQIVALLQIVLIDLTLAGDNALVVGLAVAGLPQALRRRAVVVGLGGAIVIRGALSVVAVSLLALVGLTFAGGLLLMWVCWKMFRELRATGGQPGNAAAEGKTLGRAIRQIMIADLSMSLDNVLAVAGAARGHLGVMAAGLALSVVLVAVASDLLARLLARQRWVAWVGLAVVFYVSADMIHRGWSQVAPHLQAWTSAVL